MKRPKGRYFCVRFSGTLLQCIEAARVEHDPAIPALLADISRVLKGVGYRGRAHRIDAELLRISAHELVDIARSARSDAISQIAVVACRQTD